MGIEFSRPQTEFHMGGPGLGEVAAPKENRDIGATIKVGIVAELDRHFGSLDGIIKDASSYMMMGNKVLVELYEKLCAAKEAGMSSGQAFLHLRHEAARDNTLNGQELSVAIRAEFLQNVHDSTRISELEASFRKLSQSGVSPITSSERPALGHASSESVNDALSDLADIRSTGDRHKLCNFGRSLVDKFGIPSESEFPFQKYEADWERPIRALETLGGKGPTPLGDAAWATKHDGLKSAFNAVKPHLIAMNSDPDGPGGLAARRFFADQLNQFGRIETVSEADLRGVKAIVLSPETFKDHGLNPGPEVTWHLSFDDGVKMQSLKHKLVGSYVTMGYCIGGAAFSIESPLHQSGLLVAHSNVLYTAIHEILHRTDPYSCRREGIHAIIDELYTAYHELKGGRFRFLNSEKHGIPIEHRLQDYDDQVLRGIPDAERPTEEQFNKYVNELCEGVRQLDLVLPRERVSAIIRSARTGDDIFGEVRRLCQGSLSLNTNS